MGLLPLTAGVCKDMCTRKASEATDFEDTCKFTSLKWRVSSLMSAIGHIGVLIISPVLTPVVCYRHYKRMKSNPLDVLIFIVVAPILLALKSIRFLLGCLIHPRIAYRAPPQPSHAAAQARPIA